jgi:polysaccharide biosynthesis protein PslG
VRQKRIWRLNGPVRIGIAVTVSAVVSAGAVALVVPASGPPPVSLPFEVAAAINTSNTTVGFADSDIYGMTRADIDRTLDEMQAMGVTNVRILIPWAFIEYNDDQFYWETVDYLVNAAYERDMGILGVLNSTPGWAVEPGMPAISSPPASNEEYAEFVGTVAERFVGKVSAYEVWNEPNAYFFWYPEPDPAAYTELLQAAYPAIKAADPNATVIGAVVGLVTDVPGLAISPARFVDEMYAAGAGGYFDALSYHPYHSYTPISQSRAWGPSSAVNQLEQMRALMVANGDADKLIWASEYGEPTSIVDEGTQAAFIQDFLNTWSGFDYTGPSFIYTTRDRDTQSTQADDTYGVLRDDWTWKPAAFVIENWTEEHPQNPGSPGTSATAPEVVAVDAPASATEPATATPESAPTTDDSTSFASFNTSTTSTGSTTTTGATGASGASGSTDSTPLTAATGSTSGTDPTTSSTASGSTGSAGSAGSPGSAD